MSKYDSIIINFYFFEEGQFWNMSATGYIGENDPENIELDPSWEPKDRTEEEMREDIKSTGEFFIETRQADMVSLHSNGSEFECLTPSE